MSATHVCWLPAKWDIWTGATPDDYTQACDEHVGSLLKQDW